MAGEYTIAVPVRAEYRITLPVRDGQITLGDMRNAQPYCFPIGSDVTVDVTDGEWMTRDDVEWLGAVLLGARAVSVVGTRVPWGAYGTGDEHAVSGLDRIAFALEGAITRATRRAAQARNSRSLTRTQVQT